MVVLLQRLEPRKQVLDESDMNRKKLYAAVMFAVLLVASSIIYWSGNLWVQCKIFRLSMLSSCLSILAGIWTFSSEVFG
jgi:hypothetical protein